MARVSNFTAVETEDADRIDLALRSTVCNQRIDADSVVVANGNRRFVLNSIQLNDGRKIRFLHHECENEAAPTIVFVHGFPLDHSMWQGQLPLAQQATLIMPDLSGFGQSGPCAEDVTMKSFADDIAELLDQLGVSKAVFCGLSMGGYIGWEFVKHHGEKLAGLICCNTRAAADDETTARARRVAAAQVLKTGAGPVAVAMKEKLFAAGTLSGNPNLVAAISKVIENTDPRSIAAAQLAMSQRSNFLNALDQIELPTLVIGGEHDSITVSNEMQEMSMLIGESTFVEIADAGHLSPAEQPAVFNNAVTHWLDRVS